MTRSLTTTLVASCLALFWSTSHSADYIYRMTVTSLAPKGSLAEIARKDKTKPGTIAFTPCNDDDDLKQDVVSFKLQYDPGKVKKNKDKTLDRSNIKDVYLFFYNPNALGALADDLNFAGNPFEPPCTDDDGIEVPCDPKVWAVVRSKTHIQAGDMGSIALVPLAEASDIDPDIHLYLSANENIGSGKISEQLLRSYMRFDGSQKGVWSLTGIIANAADVDFLDPATWAAWDTASFMLGTPWTALEQADEAKLCK